MRFLIDAQLPPMLARALKEAGTADGPAVIWLRFGNCSNAQLLQRLLPLFPELVERLELGDRLIEVN